MTTGPRTVMILQQPLERGPPSRDPRANTGVTRGLDTKEPLHKQFLSDENMAAHFSRLSLHNDHPYCSPPSDFSPTITQEPLPRAASLALSWEPHP
ncbi:hypothetical protein STEG23_010623 [Scotinomys teguina]